MYCPYCGNSVTEADQQCNQCGKTLPIFTPQAKESTQTPVESVQTPVEAPVTAEPITTQRVEETAQNPQQNAPNVAQGQPCPPPYGFIPPYPPYGMPYGGQPYGYMPPQPAPQPVVQRPSQSAKCPHCGSILEYGVAQCPSCQKEISWMKATKKKKEKDFNLFALLGFIAAMVALFSAIVYIIGEIFPQLYISSSFWGIGGILAVVFGVIGLCSRKQCKGKGKWFAILAIAFGALAMTCGTVMEMILSIAAGDGLGYGGTLFDVLFFF